MSYFQYFPLMAYDIKGTQEYKLLPQIIKRVKLRSGIKSGLFLFDDYDVKNFERIAFENFENIESMEVKDSLRKIYLMKNKQD